MGVIVLSYQSSEAAVDEETKKKRIKRKKLLVTVQKNRQLMNDSWRQILLTKQVTDDDSIVPGLTAFCQEFKRINDSYGELRLNLQSCKPSSVAGNLTSTDSLCMHLLKHIMAVKIESTRSIAKIRALGRQHATVGKQDRLEQFFSTMLQTLSARLGTAAGRGVMDAWRVHFDTIHKAMMTDTIRLYPELHSLRVSSCSSKHGSVSDGDGGVSDDEGSASPKQKISSITLRATLDSTKGYTCPTNLPNFVNHNANDLCVLHEEVAAEFANECVAQAHGVEGDEDNENNNTTSE